MNKYEENFEKYNNTESREALLAPYATRSKDTRGRKHKEQEHVYRSVFQRDRDRIIHSTAFRRLEYKTQVFVNHEGDHYRTRLTHTLEVAQISRTIAQAMGLNETLTESIALAHDLGHTPFGHSGEEVLNKLMEKHGGFEHNAQGLRVVDVLEKRYPDFLGINLTYEVREGFVTHSTRHDFPIENTEFKKISQPSLEAQIVAVADEIAYDNHDLDDGLNSGIIPEFAPDCLAIWQEVSRQLPAKTKNLSAKLLQAVSIRKLIDLEVTDVIEHSQTLLQKNKITNIEKVRNCKVQLICNSSKFRAMKRELEDYLYQHFYNYYTVRRMAAKAKHLLKSMFVAYVCDPDMLPPEHQRLLDSHGLEQVVCDYIAGMTDRYALLEYDKLFYSGAPRPFLTSR